MSVKAKSSIIIFVLSILSSIVYSAWLVGYFLNPTVAQLGTASELAAVSQPYHMFFVYADLATFVLMISVALIAWKRTNRKWAKTALVLYALFGMLLLSSSLFFPLDCAASVQRCTGGIHESTHMLISLIASLSLLTALVLLATHIKTNSLKKIFLIFIFLCAIMSLSVLVMPYLEVLESYINALQRIVLLISAVLLAILPILIVRYDSA